MFSLSTASMTNRRLIMVRHGQSEANRDKLVTGSPNCELTSVGMDDVSRLAPYLRPLTDGARLIVSPLKRARQTADLLSIDGDWQVVPDLAETDAGEHAEWPQSRFEHEFPDYWASFKQERAYSGGESHADMIGRVVNGIARIMDTAPPVTVAVLHNGPLAAIIHWAFAIDPALFPAVEVATASLTVLDWGDRHRPSRPILRCLGWRPDTVETLC